MHYSRDHHLPVHRHFGCLCHWACTCVCMHVHQMLQYLWLWKIFSLALLVHTMYKSLTSLFKMAVPFPYSRVQMYSKVWESISYADETFQVLFLDLGLAEIIWVKCRFLFKSSVRLCLCLAAASFSIEIILFVVIIMALQLKKYGQFLCTLAVYFSEINNIQLEGCVRV